MAELQQHLTVKVEITQHLRKASFNVEENKTAAGNRRIGSDDLGQIGESLGKPNDPDGYTALILQPSRSGVTCSCIGIQTEGKYAFAGLFNQQAKRLQLTSESSFHLCGH
jgi:hypothetical protein